MQVFAIRLCILLLKNVGYIPIRTCCILCESIWSVCLCSGTLLNEVLYSLLCSAVKDYTEEAAVLAFRFQLLFSFYHQALHFSPLFYTTPIPLHHNAPVSQLFSSCVNCGLRTHIEQIVFYCISNAFNLPRSDADHLNLS